MEVIHRYRPLTKLDTGAFEPHRRGALGNTRAPSAWASLLVPCGTGSGGSASYDVTVMVRWSSPQVVVRSKRQVQGRASAPNAGRRASALVPVSIAARVRTLAAALSLNKTQLANVLRVTRPTLYSWLDGTEPEATNLERIDRLCRLLERADVSSAHPLNAIFVRRDPLDDGLPLLELLGAESLDEPAVLDAIERVRSLEFASIDERQAKEARLQAAGFDEVDTDRRRDQLARSVAVRDWPR